MNLKGKKVLQMGLGILGGGVATARFLIAEGALVTITDLKSAEYLESSLKKLEDLKDKITFVLGEHREQDFLENEIIVINPDVPADNKFVNLARENGKQIENELTLFYKFSKSKNIIAVTGTRGKTTTTNWTYHLLKSFNQDTLLVGNDPEKPFLGEISKVNEETWVVMEVPSYQLEIVDGENFKPHIAVITNLYRDHINRHKTIEEYAGTKANIFCGQTEDDFLILNKENEWTDFFVGLSPEAKILLFSEDMKVDFLNKEAFIKEWGEHNLLNLLSAILVAQNMGVVNESIKSAIPTLPQIKFRQEKVFESGDLEIYNDTAATSPEATIAALERFAQNPNLILIAGGTDRELEFKSWAEAIKKNLKPGNLVLLGGSATEKMKKELACQNDSVGRAWESFNEFKTLEDCFDFAIQQYKKTEGKTTILFSPGCKSFEKFKNEFDRGEQFNELVNNYK